MTPTPILSQLIPQLTQRWADAFRAHDLPVPVAAELIRQGDHVLPASPTAPGEHRPVELDARGGATYVRRDGPWDLTPATTSTRTGCGKKYTATVPLRIVVVADTTEWTCRDREVGAVLAERLLAAIITGGVPLADLGTQPKLTADKLDDDAARIFGTELGEAVALPSRRAVVALNATLTITFDPTCLPACAPVEEIPN